MGNKAYRLKAIIALLFPIPVTGIKKPNIEIEGIVYKKLTIPNTIGDVFLFSAINIPKAIPIIVAIIIAIIDICKCSNIKGRRKSERSL